jgi:precorrin-3B synthase
VNIAFRRGACPGLSHPMPAGDGLLVRLMPTGATIPCEAFIALCAAARRHGNGIIEITSRGSVQIRGLSEASVERFAAQLAGIDMEFSEGTPVSCNPLAGVDADEALDSLALAAELRHAIAAAPFAARLAPKVSVGVDGGGGTLHLDAVPADVRLRADPTAGPTCVHIDAGGDAATATSIGAVAIQHAVDAVLRILGAIAARRQAARARDIIATEGADVFRCAIKDLVVDPPLLPLRPPTDPVGVHPLHDGRIASGVGLAFGHANSMALKELARMAANVCATGLRTAPGRALLVIGLTVKDARQLTENAERLGFIVHAEDPRRRIVACAGAPICASGQIPARSFAPKLAGVAATMASDGATTLHVSGCAKGCACPRSAALTVVGIDGQCGVVVNGSTSDLPLAMLTLEALPGGLSRLADVVRGLQAPDDSAAEVLSRLDRAQMTRLILGEVTGA